MKLFRQIIFLAIAALCVTCTTSNFGDIEGEWMAEGYNCENKTGLTEEIVIDQSGDLFFAIKITGDDCIQAGDSTWFGKVKEDKIIGEAKGMNPQTREYEWFECEVYENLGFLYLSVDKYMVLKMRRKD